jgi:hypothetical protein
MSFPGLIERSFRAVTTHLGGEDVVYAPGVGGAVTVKGKFDENHALILDGNVETIGPAVFLWLADLPTDPDTDDPQLTIRGQGYMVHRRVRNSAGGILLHLHRAS